MSTTIHENANTEIFDELNEIMTNALLQMQKLVSSKKGNDAQFLSMLKLFLLGIISTAADLSEIIVPGASAYVYAEIEAGAKLGGIRAIKQFQSKFAERTYSISGISPDDNTTAMNYLGQELGIALFKHIHELPEALRTQEMFLRGIEALLTNVLRGKFASYDAHRILDDFCEHVHISLSDLASRHNTH